MSSYEPHSLALIFPPMTEEEFATTRTDIEANGLIEPIVLYQDKILDGVHRARICDELGMEMRTIEYTGDDPLGYVISRNLRRRQLDQSQKAMVAAKLADLKHGKKTSDVSNLSSPNSGISARQAAEIMKVGHTSVESAKKVLRQGAPEVVAAVNAGEVPVSAASEIVDKPDHEAQRKELRKRMRGSGSGRKSSGHKNVYAIQLRLLNSEWQKAGQSTRQAFVREHYDEISALLGALSPTPAAQETAEARTEH
jgi:hypothetical protein